MSQQSQSYLPSLLLPFCLHDVWWTNEQLLFCVATSNGGANMLSEMQREKMQSFLFFLLTLSRLTLQVRFLSDYLKHSLIFSIK